ncbi:hypothetical protein ACG7TL_008092 [Trametes sanguinea]
MNTPQGPDDTFQGFSVEVDPRLVKPFLRLASLRSPSPNPFSSPTNPFASSAPPPPVPPRSPVPAPQPTPPPGPAQTSGPAPDLQPQLATAIEAFARTLQQTITPQQSAGGERHNVREPDQFDGSDPNKLRLFFAQLELVFKARPRTFDSEEKKVTYAISFLKGTALQWFEPYLLEGVSDNPPLFMYSYEAFQDELRVNFGPYDASGAAEHELMNLRMGENQRIAKYITQFTRLATQVRWGNAPLRYRFYDGLPNRLKDRISEVGKPTTLTALRDLAQSIDNRYWERKAEQSRESGGSKSGHKSSSDSKSSSSNKSSNTSATQTNSGSTPSKSTNSRSTLKTPAKTPAKPYSDKLGKDSKCMPEEIFLRFQGLSCASYSGCSDSGRCSGRDQGDKKLVRGPPNSIPLEDRVDLLSTEIVRLNASALSNPSSLQIQLYSNLVPVPFCALIDSGSSHRFVDLQFVELHRVPTNSVPPLQLSSFDGSSNHTIAKSTTLPIHFPSGEVINIDFYVTPLDKSVSAILGYSWLTTYNPLIDWKKRSIQFRTAPSARPVSDPTPATPTAPAAPSLEPPTPTSPNSVPRVSLVNASAFARACKLPGSESFTLNLAAPDFIKARSSSISGNVFNTLKKAFTTAPVLCHWKLDRPLTVETDASDYAIAGILSITSNSGELHPVAFHSRTLSGVELNYDTHNKEFLAIFECFKTWRHYLEGSATPIDVAMDHKNLEYFATMKILTRCQARWSEFLSQFNFVIWFRPGKLRAKPNALTRHWDVYPKEGGSNYSVVNPHNYRPIFTQEQLASSLRATVLRGPVLCATFLHDSEQLRSDIKSVQSSPNPNSKLTAARRLAVENNPKWTQDEDGLLCLNGWIYVPNSEDL